MAESRPRKPTNPLTRTLVLSGCLLLALVLLYVLRDVFLPLLGALLLAYILNPLVEKLQRLRLRRTGAVVVLLLLSVVVLGSFVMIALPQLDGFIHRMAGEKFEDTNGNGIRDPGEAFEDRDADGKHDQGYRSAAIGWVLKNGQTLVARIAELTGAQTTDLDQFRQDLLGRASQSAGSIAAAAGGAASWMARRITSILGSVVDLAALFFLLPVYTFLLLLDLPQLWNRIQENLPGRHRERILHILGEIHVALSLFLRGRVLIAVVKGILTSVGLLLLGVDFWLLIGMAAGVLSILPFIGPAVGLIPSAIILFFDSYQVLPLIVLVLVFVAIEGIEGYLLYPLFLGKDLELNPLSIIVSLFAGGALLGFLGVLLAVPMFCVVKILFRELVFPHIQALAAESPK